MPVYRCCEGVLGGAFYGGSEHECVCFRPCAEGLDADDFVAACRERAGLVENDRVDIAGGFERFGVAEERAEAGGAAGGGCDCCRRSEAEGAGTGDDEHGDGRYDAAAERWIGAEGCPEDERERGDGEHGGDEHGSDLIGEALDRGLGGLGPFDCGGDPGKRRVAARFRRPRRDCAVQIVRACVHPVAGFFGDRRALSREQGFVHGRPSVGNDAVYSEAVAGADREQLARRDLGDGDLDFCAVAQDQRALGLQRQHPRHGVARAAAHARFQVPTQADEADDDQGGVEEDVALRAGRRDRAGSDRRGDAPSPSRAHADHDQRVHHCRALPRRGPSGGQDRAARVGQRDGRRNGEGAEGDVGVPAQIEPAVHLHRREDAPAEHQRRDGGCGNRAFGFRRRFIGERGLIAGRADRIGDRALVLGLAFGAASDGDDDALADQVNRGGADPVDLEQGAFDAAHAGGAVHALDADNEVRCLSRCLRSRRGHLPQGMTLAALGGEGGRKRRIHSQFCRRPP